MLATGEAIDLIFVVHRYGGNFMKGPVARQLAPVFDHFIFVFAASEYDAHKNLPANSLLEDRNWNQKLFSGFMLEHLPPGFEASAHAGHVLESVLDQKRGSAQAAVAVIAVNDYAFIFVGVLQKF